MSFFGTIKNYFVGIGKSFAGQLGDLITEFLTKFVTQDVGQLAVAAAQAAEAELPGAASADKKAAAVASLKTALVLAGHDLEQFGEGLLNFLIEAAVQVVNAGAASAVAAGEAEVVAKL